LDQSVLKYLFLLGFTCLSGYASCSLCSLGLHLSPRSIIISCQFTNHEFNGSVHRTAYAQVWFYPARKPVFFFFNWRLERVRSSEFGARVRRFSDWRLDCYTSELLRYSILCRYEMMSRYVIYMSWYGGVRTASALHLLFSAILKQ
jgi:hypothetical protein